MKALKITLITMALGGVLMAQNLPNRGPLNFETYDVNGDNQITQEEFDNIKTQRMTQKYQQGMPLRNAGNSPIFTDIDENKDKVISKTELNNFQTQRFNQRRANMQQGRMMNQGQMGQGMRQGRMMNQGQMGQGMKQGRMMNQGQMINQ